jgi:hypothetical protein
MPCVSCCCADQRAHALKLPGCGDVREAADHPGDLQTNTGAYLSRRKQTGGPSLTKNEPARRRVIRECDHCEPSVCVMLFIQPHAARS